MSLDDRIRDAFAPSASSAQCAPLIAEAEAAATSAKEAADRARKRALDPALAPADVIAARRDAEDATFTMDRMNEAVARLGVRLAELREAEEDARRKVAWDLARVERDALAQELALLYPEIEAALTDLLSRIAANNHSLAVINRRLPREGGQLLSAELVARGLEGFVKSGEDIPSIVRSAKLPAWSVGEAGAWAWPMPQPTKPDVVSRARPRTVMVIQDFEYLESSVRPTLVVEGKCTLAHPIAEAAIGAGYALAAETPEGQAAANRHAAAQELASTFVAEHTRRARYAFVNGRRLAEPAKLDFNFQEWAIADRDAQIKAHREAEGKAA